MKFSRDCAKDLEFIEKLYGDLEAGFKNIRKKYVRPEDYIERALRVMNRSHNRVSWRNDATTTKIYFGAR